MQITVVSRSRKVLAQVEDVDSNLTVDELKRRIHRLVPKLPPSRQWLTVAGSDGKSQKVQKGSLADAGILSDATVTVKDLGPQIAWKTVFIVEYLGPLLLWAFFYLQPSFIYPDVPVLESTRTVQTLLACCYLLHFLKREVETVAVHRFGTSTMPIRNLFKNSAYYWANAAVLAYVCNHPQYTPASSITLAIGLVLFIVGELGNLHAHLVLRGLRRPGSTERNIPRGGLFELVSCANYFYEITAWVGFAIMSQAIVSWLFMLQGAVQQWIWAHQKHARYRKEFPNYPRSRKALIPFLS